MASQDSPIRARIMGLLAGLALCLACIAAWRLHQTTSRVPVTAAVDVLPFYLGGQALRLGQDAYDPDVLRGLLDATGARMRVGGFENYYPPSAMALGAAVADVPLRVLVRWLRPLSIATLALGTGFAAAAGVVDRRRALAVAGFAVAIVLSLRVSGIVVRTGQLSPFVVLACGLGLWALPRSKPWLVGAGIGLGAALKLYPLLLLPGARRRTVVAALATMGALWLAAWLALPGDAVWEAKSVAFFVNRPPPRPWHLGERPAMSALWQARIGLSAAAAMGASLVAWRTGRPPHAVFLACGGLVMAGSPHYHEAILLVPALAWAVGGLGRDGGALERRARWAERAGIVGVLALLFFGGALHADGPRSSPHLLPVAALVLGIAVLGLARRPAAVSPE